MKIFSNSFFIRLFLILFSSFVGLLIINLLILISLPYAKQKFNFPRTLLRYLPPLARWNYPDLDNKKADKFVILLGDSNTEGAGDAFLNNRYDYAVGHFLVKLTDYKFKLAANSGSDLLFQLSFLQNSFKNNHSDLKILKESIAEEDKLKILAFFYEGNDLQSVIYEHRYSQNNSYVRKLKSDLKKINNRFLPLGHFFKVINYDFKKGNFGFGNKNIITRMIKDKNRTDKHKICRAGNCRNFSEMQSAAPDLNKNEIELGINLTANGLARFQEKFKAKICFIYIPSPATVYSPKVIYPQTYFPNQKEKITAEENIKKSEYIRNKFKTTLTKNDIDFYDSTSYLADIANNIFIHGEIDQKHLNQKGYKFLAKFVSLKMENCFDDLGR
tara:strand:+ start:448 stop:1605 length:1158 start_codon:yes stop_codon:yes gene_type:complete